MAKMSLDARRTPGKRLSGETAKSQSVKVSRRRLGKPFSETTTCCRFSFGADEPARRFFEGPFQSCLV